MGAWNMKMVMDCLDGADVALPNWKPKKYGMGRIRRLDTYDLALLLTIANRQHDGEPGIAPADCLCYGGEVLMARIARMGTTKLEDCRDFLAATGLVTYADSAPCPKYLRSTVKLNTVRYVWKLNKPALAGLRVSGADAPDAPPPRGDGAPAMRGARPRHAGTKSTLQKTENSIIAAADVSRDENEKRAELYIRYIVKKYALTDEQQGQIGVEGILAGTKGRRPDDVRRVIDEFGQSNMLSGKFGMWIGMLIKRLMRLGPADSPGVIPPAQELEAQFSPPQKMDEEAAVRAKVGRVVQDGWNALFRGLGFAALPKARVNELRGAYATAIAHNANYCVEIVGIIVADAAYIKGKSASFEELRQVMPDVNDRADKLMGILQGRM